MAEELREIDEFMGPVTNNENAVPQLAARERLTIRGRLGTESFLPWIIRHAARLGLDIEIGHTDAGHVDIDLSGPADLIDAMEMGCLLGPIEAWVETIDRTANPPA